MTAFRLPLQIGFAVLLGMSLSLVGLETSRAGGAFVVNSTVDPGTAGCDVTECTLREAITAANTTGALDTISFNISGDGPHVIQPTAGLPTISQPVSIDATTEPSYQGQPVVVVDGDNAGDVDGLVVTAAGSSIAGLVLSGFDATGGGGRSGILLQSTGNLVRDSYIGTDPTGTTADRNWWGIKVTAASNDIGESTANGNLISANVVNISIDGDGADGTSIQGNVIGLTAAGNLSHMSLAGVQTNQADDTLIGGTSADDRNVISIANDGTGANISLFQGSNLNEVYNNYIGTDITGMEDPTPPPVSSPVGISISNNSANNLIGGEASSKRNVISGNRVGIELGASFSGGAEGNQVYGNYIGTDVTGNAPLPNYQQGVVAYNDLNAIGGEGLAGNTIAYNTLDGVAVAEVLEADRNSIRGNSIFANGGMGIDLGPAGVNANDDNDPDTGPNQKQNFPQIDLVLPTNSGVKVKGTLESTPSSSFTLDFYSNPAKDDSGFGEGAVWLGAISDTTNAEGNAPFTANLPLPVKQGHFVTATATDGMSNTSEFSKAKRMCTKLGTGGSNVLTGTSKIDVLCGKGGSDTLKGRGGNDVLLGGTGKDKLLGGAGKDQLKGQRGNDTLKGGGGNDNLDGGPGTDTCVQGSGSGPKTSCEKK